MLLKDAAPKEGEAFYYSYDMTDPWQHSVEVVSITNSGDLTTKLVDGKRAGIPEVQYDLWAMSADTGLYCHQKGTQKVLAGGIIKVIQTVTMVAYPPCDRRKP